MDTNEKKYNEALKRAKAAIDIAADKDLVKGVATTIFPQLAEIEDEDEKVWHWIREHINHDGTNMFDKAVVWLEKQKEQKPVEWSEEDDKMFEDFMHKLEVCDLLTNKEIAWAKFRLKSLHPQKLDASKLENFDPVDVLNRIKAEIERLRKNNDISDDECAQYEYDVSCGYDMACDDILSFLSTLESEKPMQEGLEKEMDRYFETMPVLEHENIFKYTFKNIARHFVEWQKEQMLKEAVEGEVVVPIYEGYNTWSSEIKIPGRHEIGDKVRIIIVKEDEK